MGRHAQARAAEQRRREGKRAANDRRRAQRAFDRWELSKCSTCAYVAGTDASTNAEHPGLVQLRKHLVETKRPFWCHEAAPDGSMVPDGVRPRKLCQGHFAALRARWGESYDLNMEPLDRAAMSPAAAFGFDHIHGKFDHLSPGQVLAEFARVRAGDADA
jgi:hypothetical protein